MLATLPPNEYRRIARWTSSSGPRRPQPWIAIAFRLAQINQLSEP